MQYTIGKYLGDKEHVSTTWYMFDRMTNDTNDAIWQLTKRENKDIITLDIAIFEKETRFLMGRRYFSDGSYEDTNAKIINEIPYDSIPYEFSNGVELPFLTVVNKDRAEDTDIVISVSNIKPATNRLKFITWIVTNEFGKIFMFEPESNKQVISINKAHPDLEDSKVILIEAALTNHQGVISPFAKMQTTVSNSSYTILNNQYINPYIKYYPLMDNLNYKIKRILVVDNKYDIIYDEKNSYVADSVLEYNKNYTMKIYITNTITESDEVIVSTLSTIGRDSFQYDLGKVYKDKLLETELDIGPNLNNDTEISSMGEVVLIRNNKLYGKRFNKNITYEIDLVEDVPDEVLKTIQYIDEEFYIASFLMGTDMYLYLFRTTGSILYSKEIRKVIIEDVDSKNIAYDNSTGKIYYIRNKSIFVNNLEGTDERLFLEMANISGIGEGPIYIKYFNKKLYIYGTMTNLLIYSTLDLTIDVSMQIPEEIFSKNLHATILENGNLFILTKMFKLLFKIEENKLYYEFNNVQDTDGIIKDRNGEFYFCSNQVNKIYKYS